MSSRIIYFLLWQRLRSFCCTHDCRLGSQPSPPSLPVPSQCRYSKIAESTTDPSSGFTNPKPNIEFHHFPHYFIISQHTASLIDEQRKSTFTPHYRWKRTNNVYRSMWQRLALVSRPLSTPSNPPTDGNNKASIKCFMLAAERRRRWARTDSIFTRVYTGLPPAHWNDGCGFRGTIVCLHTEHLSLPLPLPSSPPHTHTQTQLCDMIDDWDCAIIIIFIIIFICVYRVGLVVGFVLCLLLAIAISAICWQTKKESEAKKNPNGKLG